MSTKLLVGIISTKNTKSKILYGQRAKGMRKLYIFLMECDRCGYISDIIDKQVNVSLAEGGSGQGEAHMVLVAVDA